MKILDSFVTVMINKLTEMQALLSWLNAFGNISRVFTTCSVLKAGPMVCMTTGNDFSNQRAIRPMVKCTLVNEPFGIVV